MIGSCVPRLLGGLMARMHTHRKGSSGSTKPFVTEAPEWSLTDKNEIERLILSLHENGNDAAAIGRILRLVVAHAVRGHVGIPISNQWRKAVFERYKFSARCAVFISYDS